MKLLKITICLLTLTLLSNCAFVPGMIMKTKKSISGLKEGFGDLEIPEDEEYEYEAEEYEEPEYEVEEYEEEMEEEAEEAEEYVEEVEEAEEEVAEEESFDFEGIECMEGAILLENIQVIYIGVNNPCRISITNVPSEQLRVSVTGMTIENTDEGNGLYNIKASRPGNGIITISAGDYIERFDVRIKRIPNPVAKLGNRIGGRMGSGQFQAQTGVSCWLEDFDFDARCKVTSFSITRIATDGTQETVRNEGAKFSEEVISLQGKATTGDIYLIEEVKTKCSGDMANRKINSLVFRII